MGQQAKNGPGFTRFPGLEPGATSPVFSHDAWDMGTLRLRADDSDGSLGTAYIMSENEVSNWRWYHYYRTYAFVPTQGDDEISFIKGGYGNPEFLGQAEDKRDRYWVGIRRAGNTWTSLNPNQTGNLDLNWAASFPTGSQKGGLYNYSNSRYAQLMTNRNIPVIGSSGRSVAEIGEGDLELVPVNYYGRLWDNQTRTTFQGGGKRIQYLGSYAADPSALYKAKGNTNFTIGSDGHPVARSTDDIVFQENNNVNGWDISEVRSYYYWVHDKTKRSLGNAQGRAHNYGGDLASFNPKGVTNSNNWWFDYIMMKKATKETLRPYTIKQTYLAGNHCYWYNYSCGWFGHSTCHGLACTPIWKTRNITLYASESPFVDTWSGNLKREGGGVRPISGYADGTKNISNSGAFSNPNWNGYWDSGQPDGNGYAVQYWRRGSAPRMDDLEANRERQAYAMETYGYHGLQNAYAILETEIPDNIALTAYNGTFAASDTAQQLGPSLTCPSNVLRIWPMAGRRSVRA